MLATVLAGCAGPERGAHEMLNAVLWQQDSAEYRALAMQSYALAAMRLDEALAAPGWSAALEQGGDASGLPPAVVLDLDETVVDNARYEARIVTGSLKDVVIVPRAAVRGAADAPFVLLQTAQGEERRPVKLGPGDLILDAREVIVHEAAVRVVAIANAPPVRPA